MPTIAECLNRAGELESASDSARLDVEVLLGSVLNRPRSYLYTWPEKPLTSTQQRRFEDYFARRLGGEPVAYIIGKKAFWTLLLAVDSNSLIPRPETELLVEVALELLPPSPQHVADLGTGCGAIALALASERPQWQLLAVDRVAAAVRLAENNRRDLKLENVQVRQGWWLRDVEESVRFNMIVSNPPYIDQRDPHLLCGDLRFEPRSALVAGDGGMVDIKTIAGQAGAKLQRGGWLVLEHGYQQAEAVRSVLRHCGFGHITTRVDLAGHPRVSLGQIP